MTLEGDIETTVMHAVQPDLPKSADATTDIAEVLVFASTVPISRVGHEHGQHVVIAEVIPNGALTGDGTNYWSLILTKYASDGTIDPANDPTVLHADLKTSIAQFSTIPLLRGAIGAVPVLAGERLTFKAVHHGTPNEAFPGGKLVLAFVAFDEGMLS